MVVSNLADGSINFDTSIDTQGVNKASSLLKGRFKQLGRELQNVFGNKNNAAIDKIKEAIEKATKAYDDQINKIEELKKKKAELEAQKEENSKIEFGEFQPSEELQALIAQAKAKKGKIGEVKGNLREMNQSDWATSSDIKEAEAILEKLQKEYDEIIKKADKLSAKEEAIFQKQKAQAEAQKAKKDSDLTNQISKTTQSIGTETGKLDGMKQKVTDLNTQLRTALDSQRPTLFGKAISGLSTNFKMASKRIAGLAKRVLIFSVITKALNAIKNAFSSLAGKDKQITASLARIKGNLLTAFQPLWETVQPALVKILAIIESVTAKLAQFASAVFGKSTAQMSKNAKAMNEQTKATKEAEKSLAGFDTIQQLGSNDSSSSDSSSSVDFSGTSNLDELDAKTKKIMAYGSMILGVACLLVGIALVNIPLIITGIGLIAAGISIGENSGVFDSVPNWVHQIITWGTMIIGTVMLIVGIATVNIPLMISGAAMLGFSFAYGAKSGAFAEAGQKIAAAWDSIKATCVEKWAAITAWWSENVTPKWEAIKNKFGEIITSVSTAWDNFKLKCSEKWATFKEWWKENVSAKFTEIKANIIAWATNVRTSLTSSVDTVKTKVTTAFNSIKTTILGVWNSIKTGTKSFVNWILEKIEGLVNNIIKGINWLIDKLNALCSAMPEWVKEHTAIGSFSVQRLDYVTLPRLATGTVVPANNGEFAAVLGDNKKETEVVSPLSTMKQALKEVLAENGTSINNITLTIANRAISEATIEYINGKSKSLGVNVIKAV